MIRISFFILVVYLLACQPTHRYDDKSIFRYNVAEGITSLDPAFARNLDNISAVNQLFNGLVQTNRKLEIEPCIAKNWKMIDSGRVYRFYLRQDVFFHRHVLFGKDSTRRVVANDFVYSFNRLVDPELISPGKWVMNEVERLPDGTLNVIAINDSILEIRLKRSFPPFLGILSMQYCSVVAKEVVDYFGDRFRSNPVGTGPFYFKYWKENTKLVYLRNVNYFEKDEEGEALPYLDAIAITFIKDEEVSFLKFLKKEVDFLSGLKGSYKDELLNSKGELRDKYHSQINFTTSSYLNTEYLGFLVDSSLNPIPKEIRRAINYGFERKKMLAYLRNGIGTPANMGFIPKGLPSFREDIIGFYYSPDSVNTLLEKAGYPRGKGLKPITLSTTPQYLDICEYLQSQLSQFGITINIEVNQAATNNELIANSKASFFRKSWVADYPDAENYLSLFRSTNFAPGGPNYTHFIHPDYDQWYNEALNATNDSLRYSYYRKMDSLIIAEAPVVPLFYDQVVRFSQKSISNLGINPLNLIDLKRTKKEIN